MTFSARESSRYLGEPINLYLFRYGGLDAEVFAYTDAEVPVVYGGVTYNPLPIDRGKITSSGSLDKANVDVTTPFDTDLARLYLSRPPSSITTLIMRQGHINDPDQDYKVTWTGKVISCARKGSKAVFTCLPVSTSLLRNGLRRRYQFGCGHALFGPDCRASKAAATTAVVVTGISGVRLTMTSGWVSSGLAPKYTGGLVEWVPDGFSRETRTIIRVENAGAVLVLDTAPRGLLIGMSVDAILGCNHKAGVSSQPDGDCGPLHDNVLNFGGCMWIPLKNPIGLTNSYY
jgi:hypothetical protein